jgi:hypothetical protein
MWFHSKNGADSEIRYDLSLNIGQMMRYHTISALVYDTTRYDLVWADETQAANQLASQLPSPFSRGICDQLWAM